MFLFPAATNIYWIRLKNNDCKCSMNNCQVPRLLHVEERNPRSIDAGSCHPQRQFTVNLENTLCGIVQRISNDYCACFVWIFSQAISFLTPLAVIFVVKIIQRTDKTEIKEACLGTWSQPPGLLHGWVAVCSNESFLNGSKHTHPCSCCVWGRWWFSLLYICAFQMWNHVLHSARHHTALTVDKTSVYSTHLRGHAIFFNPPNQAFPSHWSFTSGQRGLQRLWQLRSLCMFNTNPIKGICRSELVGEGVGGA